jgi:hypothetical protein
MLWMVQRVFFGQLQGENRQLRDLRFRELATALPLVAVAILMGLLPQPFLSRLAPSVKLFVARASLGTSVERSNLGDLEMKVIELPAETGLSLRREGPDRGSGQADRTSARTKLARSGGAESPSIAQADSSELRR